MPENTGSPVSPESSHELLNAAERGRGGGRRIARDAAVNDGAFAIVLAVLIASFLLAVQYLFPSGNLLLMWGSVALYGIGVIGVVLWNQRRRRASRTGWARRYAAGFAITMALYAIGVALSVSPEPSAVAFWLPYALLTATPLVAAALWRGRR